MDMVERVARAIEPDWFTGDGLAPLICNYPDQHVAIQERARKQAIAAIEAMREPDDGMIAAASAAGRGGNSFAALYRAMIDSILKSTRETP